MFAVPVLAKVSKFSCQRNTAAVNRNGRQPRVGLQATRLQIYESAVELNAWETATRLPKNVHRELRKDA